MTDKPMRTVLIMGAGATRAAKPKAPKETRPPLDSDFFDIAKRSHPDLCRQVSSALDDLVGDYAKQLRESLETATTFLYNWALGAPKNSLHHKTFLALLDLLNSVLCRTTEALPLGKNALLHRLIVHEINKVRSPKDLTIITFNYDLVIERVLQEISSSKAHQDTFSFPGCYRMNQLEKTSLIEITGESTFSSEDFEHNGVAVLKLHGSLNWHSKHQSRKPKPETLYTADRPLLVANSPNLPENLTLKKQKTVYLKPIIVPPMSGKKSVQHVAISDLWKSAATALKKADRIVIAGYSCPPLDFEAHALLGENMRKNSSKRLYILDQNPEVVPRFMRICGVTHATTYTSISEWIKDDPGQ